jgi:hypothetical protein
MFVRGHDSMHFPQLITTILLMHACLNERSLLIIGVLLGHPFYPSVGLYGLFVWPHIYPTILKAFRSRSSVLVLTIQH